MNPRTKTLLLQVSLFLLTLITTTLAGTEWMTGRSFLDPTANLGLPEFLNGFQYSLPFLAVLTIHEFGHYFTAKYHQVRVTLPYYIPLWFGLGQSLGTLGAFIRIQDYIASRKKYFDIGIAGPLAGFVAALLVLWYGFTHLPPLEYVYSIHPNYRQFGERYGEFVYGNLPPESLLSFGDNILFWLFRTYVADPALMPHRYEVIHYPYLLAGYFSLFFTSLNLLPIGQLDGGHILYGLIGRRAFRVVAPTLFVSFMFYAGIGFFKPSDFAVANDELFWNEMGKLAFYVFVLYLSCFRLSENRMTGLLIALGVVAGQFLLAYLQPDWEGYPGFLLFIFILGRFLGVHHPDTEYDEPLDTKRKVLGWLALLIFILCFSPQPFVIT